RREAGEPAATRAVLAAAGALGPLVGAGGADVLPGAEAAVAAVRVRRAPPALDVAAEAVVAPEALAAGRGRARRAATDAGGRGAAARLGVALQRLAAAQVDAALRVVRR